VLVGALPSTFILAPRDAGAPAAPSIPLGLPAELLQRRPDIASAERKMAAANAAIGVSRAAFYPNVTFFGDAGYQGRSWHFLNLPETLWSVGSQATLPLFEGGLRRAELQRSWSAYAQTRDNYRATVLAAFQEVEDGLSSMQRLKSEVEQQDEASRQASEALAISTKLYEDGLDTYLSVSVAQVTQLAARTAEIQVQTRQSQAAVTLIRAIGGGWTEQKLPTEKQVIPFRDRYTESQRFGKALRAAASEGLVYPSRRDAAGECVGLFFPDLAGRVMQARHLDYHWDGERVDLYRDAGSGQVFRVQ
jgi:NodT family efflux transporter outer membrane factor (OMF) lipoprotein